MDQNILDYYRKKREAGLNYNFDLMPLIDGFDFYEFCDKGKEQTGDYGGFIVITNKQFVVGYNSGFGTGPHRTAFSRVYKDIHGGGSVNSEIEAMDYERELTKYAITGKINYEQTSSLTDGITYRGTIHFDFTSPGSKTQVRPISVAQFKQFQKFYEKYNEDLQFVCYKYDFKVVFAFHNPDGMPVRVESFNLDAVYAFIENRVSEYCPPIDDSKEVILLPQKIIKMS